MPVPLVLLVIPVTLMLAVLSPSSPAGRPPGSGRDRAAERVMGPPAQPAGRATPPLGPDAHHRHHGVACQLGIMPVVVLPVVLVLVVPVTPPLAVAVAAVPGESAARARPAEILRSE